MIELKDIDTSEAEKNIIQLFKKKETYFLNGVWGSGKTVFLKKVSEKLSPSKLVELKLWEIKDERSVIEIAFSQLYCWQYWVTKFGIVIAVVISILMTPFINLGFSQYFQGFTVFAGIIALIVTVWQFLKYKSDDFYRFLFSKVTMNNRVLIVDDFDRISSQKQAELLCLFNILKGCLPIVFVGDYTKISQSEGDYLKKIIDKRFELPIVLHPKNIWNTYFSDLSKQLDTQLSKVFQNIFVAEKRNLRDRKQFNELVNQEFFQNGKLYHVQIEQQLSLIYLYLFYPKQYQLLRDGRELEYFKEYQKYLKEKETNAFAWLDDSEKTVDDVFKQLLTFNDKYPSSFAHSRETYLLYETVSNLSTTNARQILKDEIQLEKMLGGECENSNDFYQFISSNYSSFTQEKSQLTNLALKLIKKNYANELIEYVITQRSHEIMPPKTFQGGDSGTMYWNIPEKWGNRSEEEINEIVLKEWGKILDDNYFDFSQKLYFYYKFLCISFKKLGCSYSHLDLNTSEFQCGIRKDFYFLTYLSIKDLLNNPNDWNKQIWSRMDMLSSTEYLCVLTALQLTSSGALGFNFDTIPENKKYIVYSKRKLFDPPHEYIDFKDVIKKNIKPRLNKLSQEGYHFEYREK